MWQGWTKFKSHKNVITTSTTENGLLQNVLAPPPTSALTIAAEIKKKIILCKKTNMNLLRTYYKLIPNLLGPYY